MEPRQTQQEAYLAALKNSYKILKPHQLEAAANLQYNLLAYGIAYLAGQMRTGKTLTTLAVVSHIYPQGLNVLFVTKKKAISSIESDLTKLSPKCNVYVINYESLHKAPNVQYACIIADESHGLGAFPKPSERFNNLRVLMSPNTDLILLSGTPTPESFSQFYHQFNLSPRSPWVHYKTFYKWAADFVRVTKKRVGYDMEVNDYSDADINKIETDLKRYIITMTQEDAGFKSQINERVMYVKMSPKIYNLMSRLKRDKVVEGKEEVVLADTAVKLDNKIHQLSGGTIIFESGNSKILDDTKARFIKDNFNLQKIAIFYKFAAEGQLLRSVFTNNTNVPEDFNTREDLVFIEQVQAVKEGVNLSTADALIYYNLDYSASTYWQSRERAMHMNRQEDCEVVFVFAEGGLEDDIYKAVKNKRNYTTRHYNNDKKELRIEL